MPSCGQHYFRQRASPVRRSYVEKRRADIQRPASVADMQVYCLHSLAIRKLLLWLAEVALVLLRLLCGRE